MTLNRTSLVLTVYLCEKMQQFGGSPPRDPILSREKTRLPPNKLANPCTLRTISPDKPWVRTKILLKKQTNWILRKQCSNIFRVAKMNIARLFALWLVCVFLASLRLWTRWKEKPRAFDTILSFGRHREWAESKSQATQPTTLVRRLFREKDNMNKSFWRGGKSLLFPTWGD